MNKRFWRVVLAVALVGSVAGCANQKAPPLETFQPVPMNPSAHFKKFDTFVVVLDTASSMEGSYRKRLEADRTREIVSQMNRMIPDMGYRSALMAFRSGSCLSCEDAVLLYGPVPYNRGEFEAGLAAYREAGEIDRFSPTDGDMPATRAIMQGNPGRVALIVVTDSENILHGRAFKTVQKLTAFFGGRLCIYPIQVDRNVVGRRVVDELVKVGGCGFSVNDDEIATPNAMAAYVNQIFLTSAAAAVVAAPVSVVADSDGDGVPDSRDTCPNTPKGVKVNAVGCWELNGVFFDSDQAVIKDTRALDEAVAILKANPKLTGEIHGHTDSTASADYNQKLSEARARAVRDYYIRQGIAPERIRVIGFGETRPAASNDTLEGRALNRRVELHPDFGH
ncbi:MAG: OmpA family protein [Deltaproteobacteria bacterium]|nr:OmpA family protein [Deltaproteobacteria bacterium]